jgi:hypothetical protein
MTKIVKSKRAGGRKMSSTGSLPRVAALFRRIAGCGFVVAPTVDIKLMSVMSIPYLAIQ